jgi:hypothetical protein
MTPRDFSSMGEIVDDTAAEIAKAALGIPEADRIHMLNASESLIFLIVDKQGMATANCTVTKRDGARMLREIADKWQQDWNAEQHAAQKARRDGEGKS